MDISIPVKNNHCLSIWTHSLKTNCYYNFRYKFIVIIIIIIIMISKLLLLLSLLLHYYYNFITVIIIITLICNTK